MAKIYFEKLNNDICKFAKHPSPAKVGSADWWKNMDKFNYDIQTNIFANFPNKKNATIRSCPVVNDAINFGYTLYNPLDLYIDATDQEQINWYVPQINLSIMGEDDEAYIDFHQSEKLIGFKNSPSFHKHAIRINTFFGIKTEKNYSTWFTHPIGRNDLPFKVIDAVVDTDKFPARFPYAMFIKKGFKGVIKKDTPLIQVVPFKREDFISEIIESDKQDIKESFVSTQSYFINAYKKLFWQRKRFE